MGCKEISSNPKRKQMPHQPVKDNNEKKEKLDYKIFRQEIKSDKTTKYFEVKLIIREITGDKSTIIGKYLFFKEDGTFQTKVLNKENNESYMIEGKLNNDGTFEFKRDVMTNKYVYKGKIPLEELKNPSQIVISGKVYINGNESNDTTFTISLPNCAWNIQYSEKTVQKNSMIYMKIKNSRFNGISYDEIDGFSFWVGVEKEEKRVKLIQQYIVEDKSQKKCLGFEGMSDKISGYKIEGDVKNESLGINSKFRMKLLWKAN